MAKTVDFVELMQGVVNLSPLRDKEYIPGIGIGALFLSLSSFLLFHIVHFPLKGKDFERTIQVESERRVYSLVYEVGEEERGLCL